MAPEVGNPEVGSQAPDFTVKDQNNQEVTLSSFRGERSVLLVFYPFAFSGLCTGELCAVRDDLGDFGHGRTRNLAAELARGEVLAFLTQDATPAEGWLAAHLEALALAPGRGVSLLMRTFALTRGLWQSSEPPSPEAAHAVAGLDVAAIYPDFRAELREALTEYWRGALACD